jgi:hypothetical protein
MPSLHTDPATSPRPLPVDQRREPGCAILAARKIAETGAQKGLEALAVHELDPNGHMDATQRVLRRQLRAQARQLGDGESPARRGAYQTERLTEKTAYDQWHRILFSPAFSWKTTCSFPPKTEWPFSWTTAMSLPPRLASETAGRWRRGP